MTSHFCIIAYQQAPPSMKSILTAVWLLTVCFGNIIVIIVAEAGGDMSQVGSQLQLFDWLTDDLISKFAAELKLLNY